MDIGVQFRPEDFPMFIESVKKAESSGFSRVYLVDGQLLWRDIYVYMSHALAATSTIPIASAVTNPFTRHFTVTASANASLAEIYPGRVMLGIGRGDNAVRTLGRDLVPTSKFEQVVPMLRSLMAGESVTFEGTELRIVWEPRESVPIMIPGTGPRNLALAGSLADVVMIQVGTNPAACAWAVKHIRRGAEKAGKDPDGVHIVAHCAMSVTEDMAAAREETRWIVELVSNHVENVSRHASTEDMPEPLTRLAGLRRWDYDYSSHLDETVTRPSYPDEVVDDVALIGPPAVVLDKIKAMSEVGVSEVAPGYLNGQLAALDVIGSQVIPKARSL